MSTVIFLVDTDIIFNYDSWQRGPCPGSELAVIHTAFALAAVTQINIHVVCPTTKPGFYNGVCFHQKDKYFPEFDTADIFVHVRQYWDDRPFPGQTASKHILWLQDTYKEILSLAPGYGARELCHSLSRFDALVFASFWHMHEVFENSGLSPETKAVAFHQPLPAVRIAEKRRMNRLIHTAHPRKAIVNVLKAFELLAAAKPELELVLCGHPDIYQEKTVEINGISLTLPQIIQKFCSKTTAEKIILLPKSLSQQNVLSELAKSAIALHPDSSIETGATTVLEAMSVGTVPIVSDQGCLPELCWRRGLVIPYNHDGFIANYAESILSLLENESFANHLSQSAKKYTQSLKDQTAVASRWTALFSSIQEKEDTPLVPVVSSKNLVIENATNVTESAWSDFIERSPNAWFTHSRSWYRNLEKAFETKTIRWFALKSESGLLTAIVPLTRVPGNDNIAVSGLWEPSGICLASGIDYPDFKNNIQMITGELNTIIKKTSLDSIIIKFSILGTASSAYNILELIPFLKANGFKIILEHMFMLSDLENYEKNLSRRLKQQIKAASRHCKTQKVTDLSQLETAYALYQKHALIKGNAIIEWLALKAMWEDRELNLNVYLAISDFGPTGFAMVFIFGGNASLWAWGVETPALKSGVAKSMLNHIFEEMRALGIHNIDYGTALAEEEFSGISEFYRRFGGRKKIFALAQLSKENDNINYRVT